MGAPPPPPTRAEDALPHGYVEEPTTDRIEGSSFHIEDEATMVDPPSFIEESVTTVRRDPRSHRDRG